MEIGIRKFTLFLVSLVQRFYRTVSFLVVFLATNPHLDNVTDDRRHSWLLADFPSVGVGIILTVRFLEKRTF